MKKIALITILTPLLFLCCKKDKPKIYLTEQFPQNWILVIDNEDPVFIKYIQRVGNTLLRSDIGRDDFTPNLVSVSHECEWIVTQRQQLNGRATYSFQLVKDTGTYMMTGVNRLATEYMLHPGTRPDNNIEWLFHIHRMKNTNGQRTITLESAAYPGNFLANEGPVGTGNGIRLLPGTPENARTILCY